MSARNEADKVVLSDREVSESEGLDDWRILLGALHTRFRTRHFATGLQLVNRIGAAAEEANHHPDLDLRYGHLNVKLVSHDVGGLTARDVRMARQISGLAAEEGVAADPTAVQELEIALDTPDHTAIKPFWQALLGLRPHPSLDIDLTDPNGSTPSLWFQRTDSATGADGDEPDRMRFHLDITVPHDVAEQRVAEAVAAGGTLVSDDRAPAFWVLADPDGNKACVCTWQGRE
ncbi:VOC family protein [Nocardioides limicola]|uniref:VOC family protein n=1 Tax=Nocardioides limicola TaxID=2803368 RepID=UPI00193B7824|nr:VOC family protein [Nocardioides sp. DJM-14]